MYVACHTSSKLAGFKELTDLLATSKGDSLTDL